MGHLLKMKRILLPALLIGLLTACSDDDKKSSQALIGKWQPIKVNTYQGKDLVDSYDFEQDNNSCPDYAEFKSDGKMISIDMDANCQHQEDILGVYTFDGSNLKVTIDGEDENYKMSSLTATEFIIEDTYSDGGVTYKEVLNFKKIK